MSTALTCVSLSLARQDCNRIADICVLYDRDTDVCETQPRCKQLRCYCACLCARHTGMCCCISNQAIAQDHHCPVLLLPRSWDMAAPLCSGVMHASAAAKVLLIIIGQPGCCKQQHSRQAVVHVNGEDTCDCCPEPGLPELLAPITARQAQCCCTACVKYLQMLSYKSQQLIHQSLSNKPRIHILLELQICRPCLLLGLVM